MSDVNESEGGAEAPQVFVSYASTDVELAALLYDRLRAEGFSVWFDRARLEPGCDWHKEIEAACNAARLVLPILTPIWRRSEWTRYETYAAPAIIPVVAAGTPEEVLTPPLRRWQASSLDPRTATEPQWQLLFRAVRDVLARPVARRLPFFAKLPYDANPYFVGREAEMNLLHEELHAGPVAALVQGRVRALTALGGVGKTTLANEYVRRFWRLYPQIFWVDARKGYEEEFGALFDQLFPELAAAGMAQSDKAARIRNLLREPDERLLILDNVKDEESVSEWIPREGGCRTLLTSRFNAFSPTIRMISLWVLAPAPAREFLLSRTGRTLNGAELEACENLAKVLGYLPLALEQAAAYIDNQKIGFGQYLKEYSETTAILLARKALGSTDYPDAVLTTWQKTTALFTPLARTLLRLCGGLSETPIPAALIFARPKAVFRLAGQDTPPGDIVPGQTLRHAITDELARYSMIQHWDGSFFQVHGLVQTVEWLNASIEERARYLGLLDDLIGAYGPTDARDPRFLRERNAAFEHAKAVRWRSIGSEHSLSLALLARLREYAYARGENQLATEFAREHLDESTKRLGDDDAITINSRNDVAVCLEGEGRPAEAEPFYRQALAAMERVLGPDHQDTITCMGNLGYCLLQMGELASARTNLEESLNRAKSNLGERHAVTLTIMHNYALCQMTSGELTDAEQTYVRVLELERSVLGSDHPDVLATMENIATCLARQGSLIDAEKLLRQTLEMQKEVLGRNHRDVLRTVNNLSAILRQLRQPEQAEPYAQWALDATVQTRGLDNALTVHRRNNLVLTLVMRRRLAPAHLLLAQSWKSPAARVAIVGPAIAYLALVAGLIEHRPIADPIGRLKALLLGPALRHAPDIAYTWAVGYFLDDLQSALPEHYEFLVTLVDCINAPTNAPGLNRFALWSQTPALPLDTPWPLLKEGVASDG